MPSRGKDSIKQLDMFKELAAAVFAVPNRFDLLRSSDQVKGYIIVYTMKGAIMRSRQTASPNFRFKKSTEPMPYKLVTPAGREMTFHVRGTAVLYQNLYGGKLVELTQT